MRQNYEGSTGKGQKHPSKEQKKKSGVGGPSERASWNISNMVMKENNEHKNKGGQESIQLQKLPINSMLCHQGVKLHWVYACSQTSGTNGDKLWS